MGSVPYTKADLIERSGLPDRTLRNYMDRGLLPRATGHGLAAEYTEEHMVRAVAIGRMRAKGMQIDAIAEHIARWSTAKFRRFVAATEPEAPRPAQSPSRALLPADGPRSAGSEATTLPPSAHLEPVADALLPEGRSFRMVPLLPGLTLMLDHEAAPIVRRIAAEISARYGHLR
jgi:DNA-binding transcriptional MerR regulator